MQSRILMIGMIILLSENVQAQLNEAEAKEADYYSDKFARAIDSQDTLSLGVVVTCSHNTRLEFIHMTDTSGTLHQISARPRDYPGWTKFHEDKGDDITIEHRDSGAGNPCDYFLVSKFDGTSKWLGYADD